MAVDCTSDLETMFRLLERVKATYESNDFDGLLVQEVHEPEPFERGIPTLKREVYRKPTPMLKARFQFAGTWTNAGAGHTWLSVSDMEAAWNDKKILEKSVFVRNIGRHPHPKNLNGTGFPSLALKRMNMKKHILYGVRTNPRNRRFISIQAMRKKDSKTFRIIWSFW